MERERTNWDMAKIGTDIKDLFFAEDVKDEKVIIDGKNKTTLRYFPWLFLPIALFNMVSQAVSQAGDAFWLSCLIIIYLIVLGLIGSMTDVIKRCQNATRALYLIEAPALLASILTGTVLDHHNVTMTFMVFLLAMPILILDIPWHVVLYQGFWSIVFIIFAKIFKNSEIFYVDLIHCVICYLCANLSTLIVLRSRLESISNYSKLLIANQTDEMTGLYNDTYFFYEAEKFLSQEHLYGQAYLFHYDFRGMRYFNKNCGFEDGDALLVEFAKCLKKVYPNDLVSRFGEDHFAVLCRNKDLESHRRLRAMMDQYFMDHYGKHLCYNEKNKNAQGLRIQLHCGVCKVTEDLDIMTICDHARIACHHIKEDSVDEIREYDHELSDQADTESYVLNNIDKAVENHYLKVYYQPVVRAMTGKLCSQEALSRWDDPELGFLAPYRFIPILEEHKQIYKVDLYAIEQVLKDFQTKEEAGIQLIPVSINLSRYDFIGRDMVQIISDLMDRYHRQRSLLEIEITESAYADSPEDMEVQIERFHKAGFQVWMDDFGSGYSSLNLLQDTNFDLIKLDMRFMRNFGEKNELIIGAIRYAKLYIRYLMWRKGLCKEAIENSLLIINRPFVTLHNYPSCLSHSRISLSFHSSFSSVPMSIMS